MKLIKIISQHKWLLLSLAAVIIFREKIVAWITEYICPITSYVEKDSWVVLVTLLATIGILYAISYQQIKIERERVVSRNLTLLWLLILYGTFRIDGRFEFFGMEDWQLCYMDVAWLLVLTMEIFLYIMRRSLNSEETQSEDGVFSFFMDTPVEKDEMGRDVYAEQLVKKIKATSGEQVEDGNEKISGAFAILLNEHYGAGKTSFMLQLEKIAKKEGIDVCWFKPWLYDEDSTLIVNLIRVLQEKIGDGDRPLTKMMDRYASVLSSVEKYEWLSILHRDSASTETRYTDIKEKLQDMHRPIIVLIDDVDRLQSEELMRVLQMVRNMADFPYVYYIAAGDKEAIKNRLLEAEIAEPDEYLKKFFNVEVNFPAVDEQIDNELEAYIELIQKRYEIVGDEITEFIRSLKYRRDIFANIRDVKRFLNLLDFDIANLKHNGLMDDVCLRDIVGLCIIQFLDTRFYQLMRDHNDYVVRYEPSLDRFFVINGFEKALQYRKYKREAAAQYAADDARIAETGTITPEDVVLSIPEVIKESTIETIDIIGDILYRLFPRQWVPHSKVGICYPTEYYKYFSASYKRSEMTNAEMVGIMAAQETEFENEIKELIKGNRITAFIHKLDWYVNTQSYQRVEILEKILKAYMCHYKTVPKRTDAPDIFFGQKYARSALDLFLIRKDETEKERNAEWNRLCKWFKNSTDYFNRIQVLELLASQDKDAQAYLFSEGNALRECIKDSATQYIEKVWSRSKYTISVYGRIDDYRRICNSMSMYDHVPETILDTLMQYKSKKYFLYHLVEPYKDGLKWNNRFMECVIGHLHIRVFREPKWQELVPQEWRQEFAGFAKENTVRAEELEKSAYLQAALHYWNSQKQREEKLKQSGDRITK